MTSAEYPTSPEVSLSEKLSEVGAMHVSIIGECNRCDTMPLWRGDRRHHYEAVYIACRVLMNHRTFS